MTGIPVTLTYEYYIVCCASTVTGSSYSAKRWISKIVTETMNIYVITVLLVLIFEFANKEQILLPFFTSVCQPVLLFGWNTSVALHKFSWNLVLKIFSNIWLKIGFFKNLTGKTGTLREYVYGNTLVLLRVRNVLDMCTEKLKTPIFCSTTS